MTVCSAPVPVDTDWLLQVARVGLVKSVDKFDPDRGVEFLAFAIPTITGAIRRLSSTPDGMSALRAGCRR
ncbi:sigma factor [Cryptosporangium sp. NPDC048952]|uniref:sigma factor n=1 Tax=Cryptosporangium sp. NPDC048952 TaxID=3363961 RepID=UPI0037182BC6